MGVGWYSGVKTENTQSAKICLNFNFLGGGGSLENLDTNLLFEVSVQNTACASQIVSHILRMLRLNKVEAQFYNTDASFL